MNLWLNRDRSIRLAIESWSEECGSMRNLVIALPRYAGGPRSYLKNECFAGCSTRGMREIDWHIEDFWPHGGILHMVDMKYNRRTVAYRENTYFVPASSIPEGKIRWLPDSAPNTSFGILMLSSRSAHNS